MGLASFNRMRRLQAEALNSTSPAEAGKQTDDETPLKVGKGPGGKFYVKQGKVNLKGPFATEEEAEAAMVTPDGEPTPIPDGWEAMTDEELIDLAGKISGEPVNGGADGTPADKARSIIQATVDDRASSNG